MNKDDLYKIAEDAYYLKADMVRFLLVENLALKTLLHEKGVFTPEEFQEYQQKSDEILEERAKQQMTEHLQKLLSGEKSNGSSDI